MPRLLLALSGGAALCLAFPGYDLWWLAPVAVALLALATSGVRPRTGFALGTAFGLVFFVPSLSWSGSYLGVLPWAALSTLQALYAGLLGAVCAAFGDRRVRPLVIALAWVAQEALRDRTPYGGFPWVRLAHSQSDSPFGRLAAWAGAPGVTFAVALAGGLLAAAGWAAYRSRGRGTGRAALRAAAAAIGVGLIGYAVPLPIDGPTARVLAVQGNVPRPGLDFNAERRAVLDNHVRTTLDALDAARAAGQPHPDLVVWPENASDIDPVANADAAAEIQRVADAAEAPVVLGGLRVTTTEVANVSFLWLPRTGPAASYVKQHPVPFAEYIPDRAFWRAFSTQVDLLVRDFVAGPGPVLFRAGTAGEATLVAGPSICFEVANDDLVRANVTEGANLLLVQTNNATFGFTNESVQQLAISRLRAIEHGRSVVHVSTVGVSGLIHPDGTVRQPTALFTSAALTGELPLRSAATLATILGPLPEYVAVLALLTLLGHSVAMRARRRKDSTIT